MMKQVSLVVTLFFSVCIFAQNKLDDIDIKEIFGGINIDVSAAIARVEAMGIAPYDFGVDLLVAGKIDEAKKWFEALGIATNEPKYVYGLAWVKRRTGDNHGAMKDAHYLLHKNPSPLLRARTLYMLGTISIDERNIQEAKVYLKDAFEVYGSLKNKFGGQYLALSMLAWAAVIEGKHDEVLPLLDQALEFNEKLRTIGLEPYGLGMYHETLAELSFVQGDYQGALVKSEESELAYREAGELLEADLMQTKIGLFNLLVGNPKEADTLSKALWKRFNEQTGRARATAYNEITLMKLDQCSQNETDLTKREKAVRAWAASAPGGKALIELLDFIMDRKNVPCPEWR